MDNWSFISGKLFSNKSKSLTSGHEIPGKIFLSSKKLLNLPIYIRIILPTLSEIKTISVYVKISAYFIGLFDINT